MSIGRDSRPLKALYFVRGDQDRWIVSHSGAEYPYQTRRIALEAAIDAANTSGKRGHDAQVQVRLNDTEWHTVWQYGVHPYPPEL